MSTQIEIKDKLIKQLKKTTQMMYCLQLEIEECKCLARLRASETDQVENNSKLYVIQTEIEKLRKDLEVITDEIK